MTHDDLLLLLDYHYWARDRLLDAVELLSPEQFTRDTGSSFPSVRHTLAHILLAERVWCSRFQGQSPSSMPAYEAFTDLDAIRKGWNEQEAELRFLVASSGESGLERVIEYVRMAGQVSSSRFWQMVQHVVNHATYHRGQVVTMLRQLGAGPPASTDLIAFYRERTP